MQAQDVETLITRLRDARRRHLDARLARDVASFENMVEFHKDYSSPWGVAEKAASVTEVVLMSERAAANAHHDAEELMYRIRLAFILLGGHKDNPSGGAPDGVEEF